MPSANAAAKSSSVSVPKPPTKTRRTEPPLPQKNTSPALVPASAGNLSSTRSTRGPVAASITMLLKDLRGRRSGVHGETGMIHGGGRRGGMNFSVDWAVE
jgi:hypothetical protein